jgi:hypothetical protein
MSKLFGAVRFESGDWQKEAARKEIEKHNFKVEARWLTGGGNPDRNCWWHITEITLDHLRPSPKWEKQMADLQLAREVEAVIRKRLKMQKQQKIQEELKLEMLKEAAIEYGWIPDSNKPFQKQLSEKMNRGQSSDACQFRLGGITSDEHLGADMLGGGDMDKVPSASR